MSSLFSISLCLSLCLFSSTTLLKHTLITDLCSWYSYLPGKPGSVYLCYYCRVNRSIPFLLHFHRNLHTQWEERGMIVSLSGRKTLFSRKIGKGRVRERNRNVPLTPCFRYLRWMRDWCCFLGPFFPQCWQLWANKQVETAFSLAFIWWVMIRVRFVLQPLPLGIMMCIVFQVTFSALLLYSVMNMSFLGTFKQRCQIFFLMIAKVLSCEYSNFSLVESVKLRCWIAF